MSPYRYKNKLSLMKNEIQSSKELPNKICINYKGYKGNFTQWRSLIDQPESSDRLEHHP